MLIIHETGGFVKGMPDFRVDRSFLPLMDPNRKNISKIDKKLLTIDSGCVMIGTDKTERRNLMTQKTFANLLKAVIVLALFCCAIVYILYVPAIAREAADSYAELAALYVPALVFVELTALPILLALVLAWQIAHAVGQDNSFCRANASRMKAISLLALGDVVYFWIGIAVFGFGWGAASGPEFILAVLIGSAGIILSVCAGALSHLILKAALLREENDLTV